MCLLLLVPAPSPLLVRASLGVAGFAIRNGNAAAVTLIDLVVFKDESYIGSLAL